MTALNLGERTLAASDVALLRRLQSPAHKPAIDELLAEADFLPPGGTQSDLVTMYARIEIEDCATRHRMALVLCHPAESAPAAGCVSVVCPIGLALIGLRVRDIARWTSPNGDTCAAEVLSVSPLE